VQSSQNQKRRREVKLKNNCVLVVVDIQEAFRLAIPDFEKIANRAAIAVKGFQLLNLPIIVTEQYPKGLGYTASEIKSLLPIEFNYIEKTTFSSYGEPKFVEILKGMKTNQVVLCGLEAHICVNQTVCDLIANDFEVHLLNDCITSRNDIDKHAGISKMATSGAFSSSVEMCLFEVMENSKHPNFREIQNLIK
jgi:nicotinamidase-related amidase